MILDAFETLLDRTPPEWVRKVEAAALLGVFCEAFQVEPSATNEMSAADMLAVFREFTAACMDEASAHGDDAARAFRERLGANALELGRGVRRAVPFRRAGAFKLVQFFYRGIGIEVTGSVPGELRFGPCSFAQRYTPQNCWLMSAFDEGFIRGVMGADGELVFLCRLTEDAPCCCAKME